MKTLARIGAGLSFAFFFLGGAAILTRTHFQTDRENILGTALGLVLVGTAFFAGPMLWLGAEKCCSRQDGKWPGGWENRFWVRPHEKRDDSQTGRSAEGFHEGKI